MDKEKLRPLLAVRAIILNEDNRVLLLKRAGDDAYGNMWCLPGGAVDFGRTAEEAVAKEVKEETSMICSTIKFLFYMDSLPRYPVEKHYLLLYFECRAEGKISLNHESSEFTWIGPEEIDKYEIAFKNDEAIKKFWKQSKEI